MMTLEELDARIAQVRAELRDLEDRRDALIPDRVFDGETYRHEQDGARLSKQFERVRDLMLDGKWRTLSDISDTLALPEASVSARLRDLRKPRFGGFQIQSRRLAGGLWRYRLRGVDAVLKTEELRPMVSPAPLVEPGEPPVDHLFDPREATRPLNPYEADAA